MPRASNRDCQNERYRRWSSPLAAVAMGYLAAGSLTGLSIWLAPFSVPNQIAVLVHTGVGALFLPPCLWYLVRHTAEYWRKPLSHISVLGYLGGAATLLCLVSGLVLTWQAAFGVKISYGWDMVHILATIGLLVFVALHIAVILARDKVTALVPARRYARRTAAFLGGCAALVLAGWAWYRPAELIRTFPEDYSYVFGADRPFAPSLAQTVGNLPIDARLLAGSLSCGTAGCHEQIVREWEPSAHRYAAMDLAFQKIQMNMAELNGPESTRYCGGCHDPISLFSGTKNLFVETERLTSLHGWREGVSCLVCHSIRQVDVKGNANYVIQAPARYLFEIEYQEQPSQAKRFLRDFLIRAYPRRHVQDLGKRLFKTPEYCGACHKQFIDQEINNLGWVQLQNQYDNWRQSRWNHPGEPAKTIECRECHMPLVDSTDPAAGDTADYNRAARDNKHRSHRFLAANQMMPTMLKLNGGEEQVRLTELWLRGEYPVPEIAHKWRSGPVVGLELEVPERVRPGQEIPLRIILTSNKVGHDFPTGPLDIIQAWLEVTVKDEEGRLIFSHGTVDEKGFIAPGTFMFKAEPVDRYGNLIDRHNLWEMAGVRYRRALFPGFSDVAEMSFLCPQTAPRRPGKFPQEVAYRVGRTPASAGNLTVEVRLRYRKIDQYLMNFLFGAESGLTAPITDIVELRRQILVEAPQLPAD